MIFLKCIIHKIRTLKKGIIIWLTILTKDFDEAVAEANKLEKTQENINNRSFLSRLKNKLGR